MGDGFLPRCRWHEPGWVTGCHGFRGLLLGELMGGSGWNEPRRIVRFCFHMIHGNAMAIVPESQGCATFFFGYWWSTYIMQEKVSLAIRDAK